MKSKGRDSKGRIKKGYKLTKGGKMVKTTKRKRVKTKK